MSVYGPINGHLRGYRDAGFPIKIARPRRYCNWGVEQVIADGENMSDLLLERGLARPYDSGHGSAPSVPGWRGKEVGFFLWLHARAGQNWEHGQGHKIRFDLNTK